MGHEPYSTTQFVVKGEQGPDFVKLKPLRQSRWEDLELPRDHPFTNNSGVRLSFVRKQEIGPAKGGVAFSTKSNLQHLIEAKPKAPAAA